MNGGTVSGEKEDVEDDGDSEDVGVTAFNLFTLVGVAVLAFVFVRGVDAVDVLVEGKEGLFFPKTSRKACVVFANASLPDNSIHSTSSPKTSSSLPHPTSCFFRFMNRPPDSWIVLMIDSASNVL